jgi:hypothetical protein
VGVQRMHPILLAQPPAVHFENPHFDSGAVRGELLSDQVLRQTAEPESAGGTLRGAAATSLDWTIGSQ